VKLSELRTCDITGLSLFDPKSDEAVIVTVERVKLDKPVMNEVVSTLTQLDSLENAEATVRDPHVCKTKDRTTAIIREDQLHQPLITIINESNRRKRDRN
jgi:hypothetical protein